jgi:hypothetical protein
VTAAGNSTALPILLAPGGMIGGANGLHLEAGPAGDQTKATVDLRGTGKGDYAYFQAADTALGYGAFQQLDPYNLPNHHGRNTISGGQPFPGSGEPGGDVALNPGPGDGTTRHGVVAMYLPTEDPLVGQALWDYQGQVVVTGYTPPAPGGGGGATVQHVRQVTNAEILTLWSMNISVVPSPGPRKLLVPILLTIAHNLGTVPFDVAGLTGWSVFSGGFTYLANQGRVDVLSQNRDAVYVLFLPDPVPGPVGGVDADAGVGLNISLQGSANPTAGDGTMTVTTLYTVIDL